MRGTETYSYACMWRVLKMYAFQHGEGVMS